MRKIQVKSCVCFPEVTQERACLLLLLLRLSPLDAGGQGKPGWVRSRGGRGWGGAWGAQWLISERRAIWEGQFSSAFLGSSGWLNN